MAHTGMDSGAEVEGDNLVSTVEGGEGGERHASSDCTFACSFFLRRL